MRERWATSVPGSALSTKKLRHHADDEAAGGQRGIGNRAHQALGRAAVDQAEATQGEGSAKFVGGGAEEGIDAGG